MKKKTAIILGATGLVGGYCLLHLLEDENYSKIISLHRRKMDLQHPKLGEYVVDFDKLESSVKHFKADDIFCCLGTTIKKAGSRKEFKKVDFDYVLMSAHLAAHNKAKQFLVVSSIGANPVSKNFYLRTKGKMEEELKKIHFEKIHIFRPSMLLGPREEFRLGESIGKAVMKVVAPLMFGKMKKFKPIQAETVALAMIKAANTAAKPINIYESDEIMDN